VDQVANLFFPSILACQFFFWYSNLEAWELVVIASMKVEDKT
jgi:hypothetical protein